MNKKKSFLSVNTLSSDKSVHTQTCHYLQYPIPTLHSASKTPRLRSLAGNATRNVSPWRRLMKQKTLRSYNSMFISSNFSSKVHPCTFLKEYESRMPPEFLIVHGKKDLSNRWRKNNFEWSSSCRVGSKKRILRFPRKNFTRALKKKLANNLFCFLPIKHVKFTSQALNLA